MTDNVLPLLRPKDYAAPSVFEPANLLRESPRQRRQARCESGQVDIIVQWAPRPEFGLIHPRLAATSCGVLARGGATVLLLSSDLRMTVSGGPAMPPSGVAPGTAEARATLEAGEQLGLAMQQAAAWGKDLKGWSARRITKSVDDTSAAWRSWSDLHQSYRGPLEQLVQRSGLVLQGLTYAPSGAIVAAATTSLPRGSEPTGRGPTGARGSATPASRCAACG